MYFLCWLFPVHSHKDDKSVVQYRDGWQEMGREKALLFFTLGRRAEGHAWWDADFVVVTRGMGRGLAGLVVVLTLPRVWRPSCRWGLVMESVGGGGGGWRTLLPPHRPHPTHVVFSGLAHGRCCQSCASVSVTRVRSGFYQIKRLQSLAVELFPPVKSGSTAPYAKRIKMV